MKLSLTLSILLLFASNAWALELEDALELTCRADFSIFQLHLENDETKSWYKFPRESNEHIIASLKNGVHPMNMYPVGRFFSRYRKKKIDSYFDVPHFNITNLVVGQDYIGLMFQAIPKSISPHKYSGLSIDRLTGALHFGGSPQGRCDADLLSELPVEPKRKF